MKRSKISLKYSLPLLLVILVSASFLAAFLAIDHFATEACNKVLQDTTQQVALNIKNRVEADREQLNFIADVLAQYGADTGDDTDAFLSTFRQRNTITHLAVLTANGQLHFTEGAPDVEMDNGLDFQAESEKVPYISGVNTAASGEKYLIQGVPVETDGCVTSILYGFVDLAELPSIYSVSAFDGAASCCVVDGATGDFILDTWHKTLGNMYDEQFDTRSVKDGNSFQKMRGDIAAGRSGHITFLSETTGEYLYSYYEPVGISQWMVQLSVPESIAMSNAVHIRHILYLLAAAESVIFLAYLIITMFSYRRNAARKEQLLKQRMDIMEIQDTLFEAHKEPQRIVSALEKVAQMAQAQGAFLTSLDETLVTDVYAWPEEKNLWRELLAGRDIRQFVPQASESLLMGEPFSFVTKSLPEDRSREILERNEINSIMGVPVLDSDHHLVGILGTFNTPPAQMDVKPLTNVARTFLMALNSLASYQFIQRMGMVDALTGLKNRNCYQQALLDYASQQNVSLGCIFIDANGLRELNNHLGHAAGDTMLRTVGETIQAVFGSSHAYRIGGDEFVVFCPDASRVEVEAQLRCFQEQILAKDYQVSMGLAWRDGSMQIEQLIAEAERRMYDAKHQYYESQSHLSKHHEMDRHLDKLLTEKKDADTFLSIISSYFTGVYVVNLETNDVRAIYKPSYFATALEQTGNHFLDAMHIYIDSYVQPGDREAFSRFLDYHTIDRELRAGRNPELHYRKINGQNLTLRVYEAADYHSGIKETFWLFECDHREKA